MELTLPGEERVLSPDPKSSHTSQTPTNWGPKRRFRRSIPTRTVWKSQPHCLSANRLVIMQSTLPGEDNILSSNPNVFRTSTNPTDRGQNLPSFGRYRPAWYGNPNATGWSLIGSGSWSQCHRERIRFHPRSRNVSVPPQLRRTGVENSGRQGRYRPARCGHPNPTC